MLSSSDQTGEDQQEWLGDLRRDALDRFTKRVPKLYRETITLPPAVQHWAEAGRSTSGSLFLTGPIGAGKTHTAWTAVLTWVAACFDRGFDGNPVIAVHRSTELFDALRPEADEARRTQQLAQSADLLFIDDLAAARVSPTGWTQERLYEIFDERYIQQRPAIITCDVLPSALEPIVGPRVTSRLAEMCRDRVLFIGGDDRRRGDAR
jgi:DNA replication protein DnaC